MRIRVDMRRLRDLSRGDTMGSEKEREVFEPLSAACPGESGRAEGVVASGCPRFWRQAITRDPVGNPLRGVPEGRPPRHVSLFAGKPALRNATEGVPYR